MNTFSLLRIRFRKELDCRKVERKLNLFIPDYSSLSLLVPTGLYNDHLCKTLVVLKANMLEENTVFFFADHFAVVVSLPQIENDFLFKFFKSLC